MTPSSARLASHTLRTHKTFSRWFVSFFEMSAGLRWHALAIGVALSLLPGAICAPAYAQNVTFAGTQITVPASGLSQPFGVAVDGAGDIFIADTFNSRVVKITPSGVQSSVPASLLDLPNSVAVDGAGDIFIADSGDTAVFKVTPGGVQTTVPINGGGGHLDQFSVGADGAGDVFIADYENSLVFKITPGGVQTTVPASGLNSPLGVAVDGAGDVFIVDYGNNRVVEVTPGGVQTTVPASGLSNPYGVAVDGAGDVFIADSGNNRVVEVTPGGVQTTVPASGLNSPLGVAVDGAGDTFIADQRNDRVVELQAGTTNFGSINVCPAGKTSPAPCNQTLTLNYAVAATTTFGSTSILTHGSPNLDFTPGSGNTCTGTVSAGSICGVTVNFTPLAPGLRFGAVELFDNMSNLLVTTLVDGFGEGPAIAFGPGVQVGVGGGLYHPSDLALDGAGDVFVSNTYGNNVVEITPAGVQTIVPAIGLYFPSAVAVDGAGDVFIADTNNSRVVEITPNAIQTTVGSGLSFPDGLAVDGAGDVFIADSFHNRLVEVTPSGVQTTVAGGLYYAGSVALDGAGDVFVSWGDRYVAEIAPNGNQTTVPFSGLGQADGLAVDAAGDVFVADSENQQVVELTPGGIQTTVGSGFLGPLGVAVDGAGDVFVTDKYLSQVVEIQGSQPPVLNFGTVSVGTTSSPQSVTIQDIGNQPLNAVAPGLTVPGPHFSQVAGSGTPADCTSTFALTPGAACNLSVTFNPQTGGSFNTAAVFTDNALNAIPSATQSIALQGTSLFSQTITFTTPPPGTAKNGGMFTVATTGGASGNPVILTVGAGSVCTVSGSTYTMTSSVGFCYVVANQAGNSLYQPAPTATATVTGASTIIKVSPTVTFTGAPFTANYLSTFTVATTENSGVTPTITATPAATCTISGNTVTMITGTGNCTVKATWAANTYYLGTSLMQFTQAVELAPTVNWTAPAPIVYGTTLSGVLDASASLPGTFVYKNGTTMVKTTTILAAGNYTLTATFTPTLNKDYATIYTSVPLVVRQTVPVTTVTSSSANITLGRSSGTAFTTPAFNVNSYRPTGTVTLSTGAGGPSCTGNVSAATGNGSCKLTFSTPGTYTITATYSGDANSTSTNNSTQSPAITVKVSP